MRHFLAILVLIACAFAQGGTTILPKTVVFPNSELLPGVATFPAATLEASCVGNNGSGQVYAVPCNSSMTVTAGDTIECNASGFAFGPGSAFITDNLNGTYDIIFQEPHPGSANTFLLTAVFQNSAGGTITPQVTSGIGAFFQGLSCYAFKGTRTSLVVDGGSVNQVNTATAPPPTSGTAASPINNNEVVTGQVTYSTFQTVTNAAGWSPAGTLTGYGQAGGYPSYNHYQIQTTATAVNSPFTSASAQFVDLQTALLNAGNPPGYRALSGVFGAPATAQSNGVTVTAAALAAATLTSLPPTLGGGFTTGWELLGGTGGTWNTAINPTGTGKIMVQQAAHTFGDAGTSITIGSGDTTTNWEWQGYGANAGQPEWLSFFFRVGSSGISNAQLCDSVQPTNFATDTGMLFQVNDTSGVIDFKLEYGAGTSGTSSFASNLALDTDYFIQLHGAGVNERNNQVLIYSKSGTWSLANTFNSDVLCTAGAQGSACSTPVATATTTGTASSGSTALTVASGTGIVVGQVVIAAGIPDPSQSNEAWTTVTAVSGTSVTLSQNTTGALSGTTVSFYPAIPSMRTATSGSASSGSTALTVVAPTYSSITQGDPVGGVGIQEGTVVAAVSGTSVTLSLPTTATLASGTGVTFWSIPNSEGFNFGKYSSCSISSAITFSGWVFDPYNDWGAFAPN